MKDSLWIKWNHGRYITDENFWTMEVKSSFSYTYKCLLNLRQEALNYVNVSTMNWQGGGIPFSMQSTYETLTVSSPNVWLSKILWNKLTQKKCSFDV